MAKANSAEEGKILKEKIESFKGKPDKKPCSVKTELPEGEKLPRDGGEAHMGSVRKSEDESTHIGHASMGHARRHLEKETERGEHSPRVGGHDGAQHSGRLSHKE